VNCSNLEKLLLTTGQQSLRAVSRIDASSKDLTCDFMVSGDSSIATQSNFKLRSSELAGISGSSEHRSNGTRPVSLAKSICFGVSAKTDESISKHRSFVESFDVGADRNRSSKCSNIW
jgi:hypothetical protein